MSDILKGHSSFADMVSIHIDVWREALTDCLMIKVGQDADHIEHELEALNDIEAACAAELVAIAQMTGEGPCPRTGELYHRWMGGFCHKCGAKRPGA